MDIYCNLHGNSENCQIYHRDQGQLNIQQMKNVKKNIEVIYILISKHASY